MSTRSLTAGLAAAALLAALPAGAEAAREDCWPKNGSPRTVERTKHARVYRADVGPDRLTFACHYSAGKRVRLDGYERDEAFITYSSEPYRLAGPYVAYATRSVPNEPNEGAPTYLVVRDLRTGRVKRSSVAWYDGVPDDPEGWPVPDIEALKLRSDGAAAWISEAGTREVRRLDSRGKKLLDEGGEIPAGSLRITSSRVHWRSDGVERSAGFR